MTAEATPRPRIDLSPETMTPDLLAQHPEARAVLDRYGLRGCGGPLGPSEPLKFFANLHGVPIDRLLAELREAIERGPTETGPPAPGVEDTIYRRFFIAGIALVLSFGAGWGAWILWQIGLAGEFTGVSIHQINAHGHAQIFGWVGLFIMGFAYQAFPRFWHTPLPAPRMAVLAFGAMVTGIIIRTLGMSWPGEPWAATVALAGGLLEITAVATFATQITVAWRCSLAPFAPYVAYVFAGLFFFVVQSIVSVWHGWGMATAPGEEELLQRVQVYQPVLRSLQVHGLALFMVLGVSQRLLPGAFGLPAIHPRRAWVCFGLLLLAVVGQVVAFLGHGWTGDHRWAAALMLPWLCLAAGSLGLAWPWRLWRPLPSGDRSGKFVRAAYGWLTVSMAMLLLLPIYQLTVDVPFSHAYYGAVRHAITVGFVSLMIVGVAAKVVPTLNGIDPKTLSPLWGPFILLNAGCALRVSLQTLTDWHPAFFAVVGVSGLLEFSGLAWWGAHLVRVMRGERQATPADLPGAPPDSIRPEHKVADVLAWFPATQPVFDRFGFAPLRNPVMRRTVARTTTLAQAAALRGVPLAALLDALNQSAGLSPTASNTALRFDARLEDLDREMPRAAQALRAAMSEATLDPGLTLAEVAERIGWSREELFAMLSYEQGDGCGRACDDCEQRGRHAC